MFKDKKEMKNEHLSALSRLTFRRIYSRLDRFGKIVSPRGIPVRELENFVYVIPPYVRFASFEARKLSIPYIKKEFLWYLSGNKYDTSITDRAKIWKDMVNEDGSINSNYGQYIFGNNSQFDRVIEVLSKDKDSRRGSIVILNKAHLLMETSDVPCTYGLNFRIRRDILNMTVHMRSQDAMYGMGNDVPAFSFIHEMMYHNLKEKYRDLTYGAMHVTVDSFHVYERHFEMLKEIVAGSKYIPTFCPKIKNAIEVGFMRTLSFSSIPNTFKFTKWLLT